MMNVNVTHEVLAGGDLLALADGQRHEIATFGAGEALINFEMKTNRGTGEGDCVSFSVEGFHMVEDGTLVALDVSTATPFSNGIKLLALGLEFGSTSTPAKLFIQSDGDLTGTDMDAVVLVTKGSMV